MDLGIANRRAAVAASSAGLGYGAAAALIEAGVSVAICGRDKAKVEAAATKLGPLATPLVADVSTSDGARGFIGDAVAALGGIDILVANAGGPPPGNFATTPFDSYQKALELNLLSTVAMCTEAIPHMTEAGWGRIIAITSSTVREPSTNLILSNTARAGATAFLKSLSFEVAPLGVTVNTVQPGLHATDRMIELGVDPNAKPAGIPVGFIGDPADFGAVCAFLASEQARFITGVSIPVDGGTYRGLQ